MREGKSVLRVFLSRSYFHIEDFSSLVNLFLRKDIKYFTCIMRIFPHTLLMENEKELIEKVTLIGLCTDICVISNAMLLKAFYPEVPISVDASACAGVTPQSHKNALEAMKMCQIDIVNE